jgi:F420-non-reducing hydrogenase small subunit
MSAEAGRKHAPRQAAAEPAAKPKLAFYWCSSCGGCEETVVDLDEKLLDVVAAVDIVFWPCALDFKTEDVEALPAGSIAVSFINGAIRTSEQEAMVKLLREKSKLVAAMGMCACAGGLPALANLKNREGLLRRAYQDTESTVNPGRTTPQQQVTVDGCDLRLPDFYETVLKLDDVIPVDYFVPGCPPTPGLLAQALLDILSGRLPKGSVLAPNRSLCRSCGRNATKPERLVLAELKRVPEAPADDTRCFLAQGVLCLGPGTRDGCESLCIRGNMPCTGCFGPLAGKDPGAKMIGALGGIFTAEDEEEIARLAASLPDPAGTFYRYSLAASLLGRRRKEPE